MVTQAALSFERRVRAKLKDWDMDLNTFASLAALSGVVGARRTKIAEALRGARNLENSITVGLEPLVKEIDDLILVLAPIRPHLKYAVHVDGWLSARRAGKLRIEVTQDN